MIRLSTKSCGIVRKILNPACPPFFLFRLALGPKSGSGLFQTHISVAPCDKQLSFKETPFPERPSFAVFYLIFNHSLPLLYLFSTPVLWSFLRPSICEAKLLVQWKNQSFLLANSTLILPWFRTHFVLLIKRTASELTWEPVKFARENNFAYVFVRQKNSLRPRILEGDKVTAFSVAVSSKVLGMEWRASWGCTQHPPPTHDTGWSHWATGKLFLMSLSLLLLNRGFPWMCPRLLRWGGAPCSTRPSAPRSTTGCSTTRSPVWRRSGRGICCHRQR